MKLIVMGMEYACAKAVKNEAAGTVRAYDDTGTLVFQAVKVADFSAYTLKDGDWSVQLPTPEEDMDAMLVDHEYRLTLLELGQTEEV